MTTEANLGTTDAAWCGDPSPTKEGKGLDMVTGAELETTRPYALGAGLFQVVRVWRRRSCVWTVWMAAWLAGLAGALVGEVRAEVTGTYLVGLPVIAEGKARYPISLEYAATAGERLAYLAFDVAGSDGRLTGAGTNYSGFTFVPKPTTLTGWEKIPGSGYGVGAGRSSVEYETAAAYLAPGSVWAVGELLVDLKGLTPGPDDRWVLLDGPDSVIGVEVPGSPGTFQFVKPGVVYATDNAAPVAQNDAIRVTSGGIATGLESGATSVLANDSDPDADPVTAVLVEAPAHGTLTLNPDGTFVYTHQGGTNYLDRFTYRTSDGKLQSSVASVGISIGQTGAVAEGGGYALNLLAGEDRFGAVMRWNIRWGDGVESAVEAGPSSTQHVYQDGPAVHELGADALSDAGSILFSTLTRISVSNLPPTLVLEGDSAASEGERFRLNLGAITDAGPDTVTEWVVDWGDGIRESFTSGGEKTHLYADGPASYEIGVDLSDEDGLHRQAGRRSVLVNNVTPATSIRASGGLTGVEEGSVFLLELGSTDAGADRITSWSIDWGDGTVEAVGGDVTSVGHLYVDGSGGATISARATDEDGTYEGERSRQGGRHRCGTDNRVEWECFCRRGKRIPIDSGFRGGSGAVTRSPSGAWTGGTVRGRPSRRAVRRRTSTRMVRRRITSWWTCGTRTGCTPEPVAGPFKSRTCRRRSDWRGTRPCPWGPCIA
jgi:hypothetical protein